MTRGSLRLRLLLAGAVSILAALTLSAIGLTLLFERHVERRVAAELTVYLDQILAGLDRAPNGDLFVATPPADPRFEQPLSGLYWQVEAGDVVLRSRSLWDTQLDLPADALPDGAIHQHRIAGPGGAELIALERSVSLPGRLGGRAAGATVALEAAEVTAATRAFAADLLPYLGVLAGVLIAAAYLQVAVGLRPLATVRSRLVAIREGRARRLGNDPSVFPREILPLVSEVDALIDERETQADRARARAADLAHGLKTPLQVLGGDVDRLRGKGEDAIAAEIEQVASTMRRHVDRELASARMAGRKAEARADVAKVVERVHAVVKRTPAGAALEWRLELPEHLIARIDPDDLAEAIGNLVENAARHARRRVSLRARRDGGHATIVVTDDGPGIPPEQLEHVLARGGRLDETGSAGLGLAIVQDIAEAWEGRFEIRSEGSGLEAEFSVPARD